MKMNIQMIQEKIKQLEKEKNDALWHMVGTSYYNQVAQEKKKEIEGWTRKLVKELNSKESEESQDTQQEHQIDLTMLKKQK